MKVLLIRHGTPISRESAIEVDTLSVKANNWAKYMSAELSKHGLAPSWWMYDCTVKPKKRIERCKNTISQAAEAEKMEGYTLENLDEKIKRIHEEGEVALLAICYTSESLICFPKLEGPDNLDQTNVLNNKPQSNFLYGNALLYDYDNENHSLIFERTVPTLDC